MWSVASKLKVVLDDLQGFSGRDRRSIRMVPRGP
jgi:hypothetical protein